eukprot:CAMPEP_0113663200 /NCGR_PEP_ID=MMETSP0038_2-20120614/1004_1 /TAXON_ID=2898 /ORGANISM="Cryptomonas paramecium" /LENGTH=349 /DNA_ID=CAMNT_0000578189 /DNA_START=22 /DNA_END=1068 /DNA_ORIENTATION=- /assembly_acc=CAM_ASM_000170
MAEMSFGNRRPGRNVKSDDGIFANPLKFIEGCVMSRPEYESSRQNLVVDFPCRPPKMTAAVLSLYGPVDSLKVQQCDLPRLPMGKLRSTEVVVEVFCSSVNPIDWKMRKGTLSELYPLTLPTILGIDFSGRVVRAGEDSTVSVGDEVYGRQTLSRMRDVNGTYAEYVVVECADLALKPERLSFEEAAAVPQACLTAYAALGHIGKLIAKRRSKQKSVLILGGSGGVGTFAVQLAKRHFGCFVAASCSSANAGLLRDLGVDQVLDYRAPDFLGSVALARFDVVLDCVGGDDYWQAFRTSLATEGVYVTLVGSERGLGRDQHIDGARALGLRADYMLRQLSGQLGASENYH